MTKFTGHKLKLDERKIETPSVFTIRYRWISIPLAGADVPCKYSLGLKWFLYSSSSNMSWMLCFHFFFLDV